MKVVLVNLPRSLFDLSELSPPLGLLRIAGATRAAGAETVVIDFNLLYHLDQKLRGTTFYERALEYLLAEGADIYGFTSMAVDSHVGLHLAKLIKHVQPQVVTVLGGPHYASIAEELLSAYPWIDVVVKGEGENAFTSLIETVRARGASVKQVILSAEPISPKLPLLDYSLVDLPSYFTVNPRRLFDFEGGRGCRFKCAFCYSPVHYPNRRTFEVEQKIEELHQLVQLGAKHVFFVEDNFLNSPEHAIIFCRELEKARLDLTWHCYVTLPQLSSVVIDRMSRAGCTAVFTGVDAVGQISQREYRKGFLKQTTALENKLFECVEAGITPTCAFLLSPPSHPCGKDFEETIKVALMARNRGAQVRLNTLTLYNGTKSQTDITFPSAADDLKTRLMLDVPEAVEFNEYAEAHPQLFPFHSRYVRKEEWKSFVSLVHCLFTLYACYPKTLDAIWEEKDFSPVAIAQSVLAQTGDLLRIRKPLRRDAELAAAVSLLEKLVVGTKAWELLETESESLLMNVNPDIYWEDAKC